MKNYGNAKLPQVTQNTELNLRVTPTLRLRLGTVRECRRELAKVYADARGAKIELSDATRLAYILTSLANMIRDSDLEERVELLEAERARQ